MVQQASLPDSRGQLDTTPPHRESSPRSSHEPDGREPSRDAAKNGGSVHRLFEDVLCWEAEQQCQQDMYEAEQQYLQAKYEEEQQCIDAQCEEEQRYYQEQEEELQHLGNQRERQVWFSSHYWHFAK